MISVKQLQKQYGEAQHRGVTKLLGQPVNANHLVHNEPPVF